MSLAKLMQKPKLVVLGLNSGTSADGVDMAALEINRQKNSYTARFIRGKSASYPAKLRSNILDLADSPSTSLERIILVNNAIGEFFGSNAVSFVNLLSKKGVNVDIISSHGQTVRHIPAPIGGERNSRGTLQLGSLELISTLSGKITVGDFRQADIAMGNEGAPITVAAMQRLFQSNLESRLIVNIGGISNYFYFPKDNGNPQAADCGPGNSLCDILCSKLFKVKFDVKGKIAQTGKPSKRVLTLLMAGPFFTGKTISTGREVFGETMAERIINLGKKFAMSHQDVISTAAELTVTAIVHKMKPLIETDPGLSNLYLTGGGRKNRFFVKRLQQMLPNIKILNADQLGFNADFIESAAYAVMGEAAIRSEALRTSFNGKKPKGPNPVLGKIVQPPQ
jgi:anhydro-N-acetylmuramic acid kinase